MIGPRAVRAVLYDGESSEPRPVEVRVSANGITLQGDDGLAFLWPAGDVERLEGPAYAGVRLACSSRPGERLTITDPDAAALMQAMLPELKRARSSRTERRKALKWIAGGLVGIAALGLLAFEGLPRAFAELPMSWAAPVGDNVRRQIVGVFRGDFCEVADAQAALDRLKGRLLAGIPRTRAFDPALVDIRLSDNRIPNALAAPGGRIVVFAGLFDLLSDDADDGGDELAAVLAHEIAHARLRHPTQAVGRSLGVNLLSSILGGGMGADAGAMFAQFAYTRDAEREADELARAMLRKAGVGDAGLKRFFERLSKRFDKGGGETSFFSTHPASAERAAASAGLAGPERAFTEAEWRALRKEACGN